MLLVCDQPGGASTQIIFRHAEAQQHQQQAQQAGLDADKESNSQHVFVSTGNLDGIANAEAFSSEAKGGGGGGAMSTPRNGASDDPISPDDFWGMSHLGYGVMEVG